MFYKFLEKTPDLIETDCPVSTSQTYNLGVSILNAAVRSLGKIEDSITESKPKFIGQFRRQLKACQQEIAKLFHIAINNEISYFYQHNGLMVDEAGEISAREKEIIIYPILKAYLHKLKQLQEIARLMNVEDEGELLMICVELNDCLYGVLRQLSHLYPVTELREVFREMAQMIHYYTPGYIAQSDAAITGFWPDRNQNYAGGHG